MSPPLYQVVINTIIERIASGALPSGSMLPSETQLGAELGVSQGTARKALMELEARGLLQRAQGRGTFVTVRTPESSLFNFFRLRRPDGSIETPKLEAENVRTRAATKAEEQKLFGAPKRVIEIERVRSLGGRKVTHEISVVSTTIFPGLDDRAPLPNTLYVFYQQAYSTIIIRADEQIRTGLCSSKTAEALGILPQTPMLEVRRQTIDMLDRVVELRTSYNITDKHEYFVSLS